MPVAARSLPYGIDLMVSVHTMGSCVYLQMLWYPTLDSVMGASSPHSSFFCATLSFALASTM